MESKPPAHARLFHTITTPRLIIRSGIPSDAKAVTTIRSDSLNNPHGGVNEPNLSIEAQAKGLFKQKESTAQGKNAWMQILLKPQFTDHVIEELLVEDGVLIGMTGFNCFLFVKGKGGDGEEAEVLLSDTGAMIDYRYSRKGYALETMEAILEYGFHELGCGLMRVETSAENIPWRALMKTIDLEDAEEIVEDGKEIKYLFDGARWEECKLTLEENGKWLL